MITLAPDKPQKMRYVEVTTDWENDKSIGMDIHFTAVGAPPAGIRKRIFFPKSVLRDINGAPHVPTWIFHKRIEQMAAEENLCRNEWAFTAHRGVQAQGKNNRIDEMQYFSILHYSTPIPA